MSFPETVFTEHSVLEIILGSLQNHDGDADFRFVNGRSHFLTVDAVIGLSKWTMSLGLVIISRTHELTKCLVKKFLSVAKMASTVYETENCDGDGNGNVTEQNN